MKSITTLLLLCLMTLLMNAQKGDLLQSKWKYKGIADKEKMDSNLVKQANAAYAKMEIEFASDGKYSYNPLGDNPYSQLTGTWELNKEQTKVSVSVSKPGSPENKQTSEWEIKNLTQNELTLKMGTALVIFNRLLSASALREKQLKELAPKQEFKEGLAAVQIKDKWGFIDKTGKEVIPLKYDYAENFDGGLAVVRIGKYPNYKYGFINKAGEEVIALKYDRVGNFANGLTSVNIGNSWGFIDKKGREVIPLTYGGTWDFKEGLAMVRNGAYLSGKCGFIDSTGKVVIPLKYDAGDLGFQEGLALVNLDQKYGFINKKGTEVIPLKYDFAFSFKQGVAVVNLDKKFGFIDKTGKEITALKYENVGETGITEGLASVKLNGKWGFVDKTGKETIPLKYDKAKYFSEGLAAVGLNGKWGFIDKTGKVVIPLIYDETYYFTKGKGYVKLNNRNFYIDKKGNEIN